MTSLTTKVGAKLGIIIPQTNGVVLNSKTPINRILTDDLKELTARNVQKLGFSVDKVVNQISKDISHVYFGKVS